MKKYMIFLILGGLIFSQYILKYIHYDYNQYVCLIRIEDYWE